MAEKITGYTSEMCQQAMIDELKELFRDMKFTGQEGEKPLKIFKQFIPSPTDDDDDVDIRRLPGGGRHKSGTGIFNGNDDKFDRRHLRRQNGMDAVVLSSPQVA